MTPLAPSPTPPPSGLHVAAGSGFVSLDSCVITVSVQAGMRAVVVAHGGAGHQPVVIEVSDTFGVAEVQSYLHELIRRANRYGGTK